MAGRDEIIAFCDDLLEIDGFEDYGPNGMQVPGGSEVARVTTGVTPSLEHLRTAVAGGADLIITHHQLFFGGLSSGLTEQMTARLRVVMEADATVASYHLPLDAHREIGNNVLLCGALGLELDPRPFAPVKGRAIGAIGLSSGGIPAGELRARLATFAGQEPISFEAGPDTVRSVGIVTGAGAGALAEAGALGLDALVTGEAAEHAMPDARELGIHFHAAGHYATERCGVTRLGELIAERFGVEHVFVDVPNPV